MESAARPLQIAGDNLKLNLKTYLDSFRLINDSYIIMDAAIHNFGLVINVISVPGVQKVNVVQSILTNLKKLLERSKVTELSSADKATIANYLFVYYFESKMPLHLHSWGKGLQSKQMDTGFEGSLV